MSTAISVSIPVLAAAFLMALGAPASGPRQDATSPSTVVYAADENLPPYEYRDDNGKPAGFNIALMEAIAVRANVALEIRLMPWHQVIAALDRHQVDLVSLAYSDARAERYALLQQTWTLQQAVLFKPGRASYPDRMDKLATETVAVEERSPVHELLGALPEVDRPTLVTKSSQADALDELVAGSATAVAGNDLSLRAAAARRGEAGLIEVPVKSLAYYLATWRGHEAVLGPIANAFRELHASGATDRLVEHYLVMPTHRSFRSLFVYAVPAAALLLIGAGAGIVWTRTLRARVKADTLDLLRQRDAMVQQAQLLDLAHEAIIVTDLADDIVFWNKGAEETYGWSSHEAVHRNMRELLQTEGPRRAQLDVQLSRNGRWEGELVHTARNGRKVRVMSRWALQRGPDGVKQAILKINSDVTEERDALERLRVTEERLRAVLDNMLGGLLVVDQKGRITHMNPAAERLTGWVRTELIGQPMAVLLPARVADLSAFYADVRERAMGRRSEWDLKRKDGTLVRIELSLFQFHAAGEWFVAGNMREIQKEPMRKTNSQIRTKR
jgi:PAS domain S-box-containing protein